MSSVDHLPRNQAEYEARIGAALVACFRRAETVEAIRYGANLVRVYVGMQNGDVIEKHGTELRETLEAAAEAAQGGKV